MSALVNLCDRKQLLNKIESDCNLEEVPLELINPLKPEDQSRNIEVDSNEVRRLADDFLQRIADGLPPLKERVHLEYTGMPGNPRYDRVNGNHRIEGTQLAGLDTIDAKVFPKGYFDREGIPKRAVQVSLNEEPFGLGQTKDELEKAAKAIFSTPFIGSNVENLKTWLVGQQTRYPDDELRKIAKRVAKTFQQQTVRKAEGKYKMRQYIGGSDSKAKKDTLRHQTTWINENWDQKEGRPWALNASTPGMFSKIVGSIYNSLTTQNVKRDPTTKYYPPNRPRNSVVFHVKLSASYAADRGKLKEAYAKRLKEMATLITDHDIPIDAIYRYPIYFTQEDMKKPVLLWSKAKGYEKDVIFSKIN